MYYIAIDIGGTFTDSVALDSGGKIVSAAKSFSIPQDPSQGVMNSLQVLASNLGFPLNKVLAETDLFIHGCTIGTNSIIERTGARTGLVTTKGHKDAIFIGRVAQKVAGLSERELTHQVMLKKAEPPLVDPLHVWEVSERIDHEGKEVVRLNVKDVETAAHEIKRLGIESVAVSCLWSFLNSAHEEEIKKILRDKMPGLFICASSEIAPLLGEYERTVTTVLSAYIAPKQIEYLKKLQNSLQESGFRKQMLVGHSMGGASSLDEATNRPLLTLDSGPAGGVLGARYFGAAYREPNIIAVDMGGTSFDVSLICGGEIGLDERPVIAQYSFLTPKIATYSIGAGGGSIVWIDPYGIPQVGPQSAGASPGSVCYGLGGTEPTITDVDLILGYLNPEYFLGGRKKLDRGLAEAALMKVSRGLGLDLTRTAVGAFKIVNSHMADLVRKVSIERGYDPRNYVLFAFGGAGPTHCPFLGQELGAKAVYVPNYSSVFSALGMLTGGIVHSLQRSYPARFPLSPEAVNNIKQIYGQLESNLYVQFSREGISPENVALSRYAYIKYRLQATELPVPLNGLEINAKNQPDVIRAFETKYASVYGENTGYPQAGIEVLKYRVDAFYPTPVPQIAPARQKASSSPSKALKGKRQAYFDPPGKYLAVPVYEGSRLRFGNKVRGPAVVERMGDTVVVPPETTAYVDGFLNIKIELQ